MIIISEIKLNRQEALIIKKLIGQTSFNERIDLGMKTDESEILSGIYDEISQHFSKEL